MKPRGNNDRRRERDASPPALHPAAAVLLGSLLLAGCAPQPDRPNVLVISVDTLRMDRLGVYGGPPENTPQVDRLAREGVRVARTQAVRGLTWPSISTLHTGLHPRSHGVRLNGDMLPDDVLTVPEHLQTKGYTTGAFISNMCDAPHRGFDKFVCSWWEGDAPDRRMRRAWANHNQSKWDSSIADDAITFIRAASGPFYAWVHFVDPHKPFDAVPEYLRDEGDAAFLTDDETLDAFTLQGRHPTPEQMQRLLAVYDSQIASTDAYIGRILAALDEAGLAENTLVLFTADHGEELGEHQNYFYHLCSVYQQVLDLPWIMRWPGHLPEGRVVETTLSAVDIAPTLLGLMGVHDFVSTDGASRAALLRGEAGAPPPEVVYSEWSDLMVVVGRGDWRYIWNPYLAEGFGRPYRRDETEGFKVQARELYDLSSDPDQQNNVVEQHPEVAAAMQELACDFVLEKPFVRVDRRSGTEDVRQRLEGLGYAADAEDPGGNRKRLSSLCPGGS